MRRNERKKGRKEERKKRDGKGKELECYKTELTMTCVIRYECLKSSVHNRKWDWAIQKVAETWAETCYIRTD